MVDISPRKSAKAHGEEGSWFGAPWNREPGRPGPLAIALIVAAVIGVVDLATTLRADPVSAHEGTNTGMGRARQALAMRDYTLARNILMSLAAKGDSEAEVDLGMMSKLGEGTTKNIDGAAGWYRKAANSGNAEAASRLGDLYLRGVGVAQDFTKAHHWLDVAANEGVADAQLRLGRLYEHGWGVARDPVQAYAWYEMAARQDEHQGIAARDRVLASLPPSDVAAAQAALGRLVSSTPVASAAGSGAAATPGKPATSTAKPAVAPTT